MYRQLLVCLIHLRNTNSKSLHKLENKNAKVAYHFIGINKQKNFMYFSFLTLKIIENTDVKLFVAIKSLNLQYWGKCVSNSQKTLNKVI